MISLRKASGIWLPSVSIVVPVIIPFASALAPVGNSPITSAAIPFVIFYYTGTITMGVVRDVGRPDVLGG